MSTPKDECVICHEIRPVAEIGVMCNDRSIEEGFTKEGIVTESVHFCKDNIKCFRGAQKKRLIPTKVEEGP